MATTTNEIVVYAVGGGLSTYSFERFQHQSRFTFTLEEMSTYSLKWLQQLMRFTFMLGANVHIFFRTVPKTIEIYVFIRGKCQHTLVNGSNNYNGIYVMLEEMSNTFS